MKITFLGHSCFLIETCGKRLVVDPYFHKKQTGEAAEKNVADYVLLTHAHDDHMGNIRDVYAPNRTVVIANFEICNLLIADGVKNVESMNTGGSVSVCGITVTMVPALHSSSYVTSDGRQAYAGLACGYIISDGETTVYHAGDTGVFGDMALINELYAPEIGLIPIGGKFTMDIRAAVFACNKYFRFRHIIPMHVNTVPAISANVRAFASLIKNSEVVMLDPGASRNF